MKELELIKNIRNQHRESAQNLTLGIGDDCAVFRGSEEKEFLISTDLLIENIHFNQTFHPPKLLGRKAIAVNLSDIAAMGGRPEFALLSLAIPPSQESIWLDEFHIGVSEMLRNHHCLLIGGDTTTGETLAIGVTVIGATPPGKALYRSAARDGHSIYVTGTLGSSAAGLAVLKRGGEHIPETQRVIKKHLDPQPQIDTGVTLRESGLVSAMQDLSDGLATDLSHICAESGVKAIIREDDLPFDPAFKTVCDHYNFDPTELILKGGEDYELVFTAVPENHNALCEIARINGFSLRCVGKIVPGSGVYLLNRAGVEQDISYQGFEHQ